MSNQQTGIDINALLNPDTINKMISVVSKEMVNEQNNMSSDPMKVFQNLIQSDGVKEIMSSFQPEQFNPPQQVHDQQIQVAQKEQEQITEYETDDEIIEENSEDKPLIPKTKNIYHTMNIKLQQFYEGKQKKIKYLRKTFKYNEKTKKNEVSEEKKSIHIPIVPGSRSGDKITFNGEADRKPGYLPGDVVITLVEEEDAIFQRYGDNLLLLKNISFSEIYHIEQTIVHLDNRKIKLQLNPEDILVDQNMTGAIRKITGEGMPIKDTNEKGDLYIRFIINFPDKLTPEQIKTLRTIIPPFKDNGNNNDNNDNETEGNGEVNYTCVLETLSEEDMDMLYRGEMSDTYSFTSSEDSEADDDDSEGTEADDSEADTEGTEVVEGTEADEGTEVVEVTEGTEVEGGEVVEVTEKKQ